MLPQIKATIVHHAAIKMITPSQMQALSQSKGWRVTVSSESSGHRDPPTLRLAQRLHLARRDHLYRRMVDDGGLDLGQHLNRIETLEWAIDAELLSLLEDFEDFSDEERVLAIRIARAAWGLGYVKAAQESQRGEFAREHGYVV